MVVIVVIIMGLVTACHGHGGHGYEQKNTDLVLCAIFHNGGLRLGVHKPCQSLRCCRSAGLVLDMSKNVDISPQSENATKVV
jgi:hypothetical protein